MAKRTFIMLTPEQVDQMVAASIESRERELASYDIERDSHEAAIAELGNISWEDNDGKYKKYRNITDRDQRHAKMLGDGLTTEDILTVADLVALDRHKIDHAGVLVETGKSEKHYENAKLLLPAGDKRDTAIAAHQTEQAAIKAARISKGQG